MTEKDLVALVADKNMEHTLKGLFTRHQSLRIRPIETDIHVHPEHDPGCALRGVEILTGFAQSYRHGILMFDHEGSGKEETHRDALQRDLDQALARTPWQERAKAIVLAPELEAWVWSGSPHVDDIVGWAGISPSLSAWLIAQGWLAAAGHKPARPKEAFRAALRKAGTPRSSSLYQQLAKKVSLQYCTDAAFLDFRQTLVQWFAE